MFLLIFVLILCYRCELLSWLCLFFDVVVFEVDEMLLVGEVFVVLVECLVLEKVCVVVVWYFGVIVIGFDQVVEFEGEVIGKFGIYECVVV